MNLKVLLLIGLVITLVGCQTTTTMKPTKPTLNVIERDDGGICLTHEDTVKLGNYILNLESYKTK